MAEQLGEAVLKLSVDATALDAGLQRAQTQGEQAGKKIADSLSKPIKPVDTKPLEAGLQRAKKEAEEAGKATEQAFTKTGKPILTAANGLEYFIDANGRARKVTGQFVTVAELQAAGLDKIGGAASRAGAGLTQGLGGSVRSIQSLEAKLQGLRQSYASVEIGSREFRKLQGEIQRTERELAKVDQTLGNTFRQRAGGFGSGLLGALGLGVGVGAGAAIGGFLKGSIDEAVQLESITRKLQNTLGPQGAGAALNFTKGLSRDLGLNFKTLADSFGGFTAAATAANVPLETQRSLFAAVSKAGQSLGLSNDAINGSFLALQQVASKGTVAMEELRGQLGERLPIALSATAKGLGISQQQLIKLVESGKLTAAQFFPALTKGLNELTAGAGGLETAAQSFQRFQNAWQDLQASFGTNLLPGITKAVKELTGALEGLGVESEARGLRGAFGFSADEAIQTVGTLRTLREQYNLTQQQARNIVSDALAGTGVSRNIFGELNLSSDQFAGFLTGLIDRAKEFRATNRDIKGELLAQAAEQQRIAAAEKVKAAEAQKQLDATLRQSQGILQLRGAQEQLDAARLTPGLDEAGRARLQAQLSLSEKLRAVESDRLELNRELEKPKGTGDGKDGTQSLARIADLQSKIQVGELAVNTAREQGAQAEAQALRTQQERFRATRLDAVAAADKLRVTQELTRLEEQAALRGTQVSETAKLQLQQQLTLAEKLRQQDNARAALQTELAKPKGQQDRVVIGEIQDRIRRANQDVRQAYADAGLQLVQNARTAAEALKGAQQGLESVLRGGFEFLTPSEQQRQITLARASIAAAGNVIRTDIDTSTPDKLFRVAAFAESYSAANKTLERAIAENTDAQRALVKGVPTASEITGSALESALQSNVNVIQALVDKNWLVNINVPGGSATGDVVGAINGGL